MSNQISSQAAKVWQTISNPGTIDTYRQAGIVTWTILRETGILLWFVFCLVLVAFDWFWNNSIQAGRNARNWLTSMDQASSDQIASEVGKTLLEAGKSSLAYTVSQARVQLGLPEKPVSPEPVLPAPVASAPAPAKPTVAVEPAPSTPAKTVSTPVDEE